MVSPRKSMPSERRARVERRRLERLIVAVHVDQDVARRASPARQVADLRRHQLDLVEAPVAQADRGEREAAVSRRRKLRLGGESSPIRARGRTRAWRGRRSPACAWSRPKGSAGPRSARHRSAGRWRRHRRSRRAPTAAADDASARSSARRETAADRTGGTFTQPPRLQHPRPTRPSHCRPIAAGSGRGGNRLAQGMIPKKKTAPDAIRGEHRFSDKIKLTQQPGLRVVSVLQLVRRTPERGFAIRPRSTRGGSVLTVRSRNGAAQGQCLVQRHVMEADVPDQPELQA